MLKQILVVWLSMSVGALVMGIVGWTQLAADPVLNLPQDIIGCPDDMARVGPVCVDKYEASVFRNAAGTGFQVGVNEDNYGAITVNCSDDGQTCNGIFAHSKAGVLPSTHITWFQAQQACANVGKRLLRNDEWQMAAAGTPDPGQDNDTSDCNIRTDPGSDPVLTGSRSLCKSRWEVFDMVGNVWEWVAEWVPRSTTCGQWSFPGGGVLGDIQCLAGASTSSTSEPGALIRGGSFSFPGGGAQDAGVFAVSGLREPSHTSTDLGFRCAR